MGARREVWGMYSALAELEQARGNAQAAVVLQARARAEIAFIADHAGTPELKAAFLARAELPTERGSETHRTLPVQEAGF